MCIAVFCPVLEIGTSKVDILSNNKFHHPPRIMVTLSNKDCLEAKNLQKLALFQFFLNVTFMNW